MKKKEYIQWDKKLITDISIQKEKYKEQKFDESDSSKPMQFYSNSRKEVYIWNEYSIYAYKRSFDYNYMKLRTLKNKQSKIETKICGKDFYNNPIYYPIYEKCPINFIEISELSTPSLNRNYNFTTFKIGNKYLHYTNEYIDGYVFYGFEIADYNISCDTILKRFPSYKENFTECISSNSIYDTILIDIEDDLIFESDNQLFMKDEKKFVKLFYVVYGENYDEVNNVDDKFIVFRYFKYFSFSLILGIIFGFILLLIIFIILICYCCKCITHGVLGICLFYFYLIYIIFYLPLFIVKVKLDYIPKYKVLHYLHFGICFFPVIMIIVNLCYIPKARCKQFWKIFLVFIIFIIYFLSIIIYLFQNVKGKIDKGRFEDFYNIFNIPPITEISSSNNNGYKLGIIEYSNGKHSRKNKQNLLKWEGREFTIKRHSKEYKYSFMLNYDKSDKKQCGIDHKGNKLYLPNNVKCPINYIEITENEEPSYKEYTFETISLDSNKYLHYTNEFINNEILFDLKIADENIPYSSTKSYNSLCYSIYIYSYKYCNYGKNYYDFENKSGYSLIDKELLSKLILDNYLKDTKNNEIFNLKYSYLYNRTYSALEYDSQLKKEKLYDYNLKSKYMNLIYILLITIFVILFTIGFCKSIKCFQITSLIFIIFSFIIQLLNVLFFKYIKKNFFDLSFLDIAKMSKNYPVYYVIDLILLINDGLLIIISLFIILFKKGKIFRKGVIDSLSDIYIIEQIEKNNQIKEKDEIIKNLEENNKELLAKNKQNNIELDKKNNEIKNQEEKYKELDKEFNKTQNNYQDKVKNLEMNIKQLIKENKNIQKEKEKLIREKESLEEEKIKIQKEIDELIKNNEKSEIKEGKNENTKQLNQKLDEKEKLLKELNRRISSLQDSISKKLPPKKKLENLLFNLKDSYKEKDYFGNTKKEMKLIINDLNEWLVENENNTNEKAFENKLEEIQLFLIRKKEISKSNK